MDAEQELAATKGHKQMLQEQLRREVEFYQERLKKQIQSCSELEVLSFILVKLYYCVVQDFSYSLISGILLNHMGVMCLCTF